MKVEISLDVEVYPATVLAFENSEEWQYASPYNVFEVPDEIAQRWQAARDALAAVEEEAEKWVGTHQSVRQAKA